MKTFLPFFLGLLFSSYALGQTTGIVEKIAVIDEVQHKHIGSAGQLSENYQNYQQLGATASTDEVLQLLVHSNAAVACYASWILIDREYPELPGVFAGFLDNDRRVKSFIGCTKMADGLANEFYHRYWGQVEDKETDPTLLAMDSLILHQNKTSWLLRLRALENRLYPVSYNERIATLAFDKGEKEAIFYLANWYKGQYRDQIREALIKYLRKTDFSTTGTTDYYDVVNELLQFNDKDIENQVIQKLKKDKHWEHDKERFWHLLNDYQLYPIDFQ